MFCEPIIPVASFDLHNDGSFYHLGFRFLICKMKVIMTSIAKVVLICIRYLSSDQHIGSRVYYIYIQLLC